MSYKKSCNRCGQQILMDESLGKWKALNVDGTAHICEDKSTQSQPQVVQQPPKQEQEQTMAKTVWGVLEQFNKRIKKLESMVLKEGTK